MFPMISSADSMHEQRGRHVGVLDDQRLQQGLAGGGQVEDDRDDRLARRSTPTASCRSVITNGCRALRTACFQITFRSATPLARAVWTYCWPEHVEQVRPHHAGEPGRAGDRDHQQRHPEVAEHVDELVHAPRCVPVLVGEQSADVHPTELRRPPPSPPGPAGTPGSPRR